MNGEDLSRESHGRVRETVSHLLTDARLIALDQEKPPESRVEAIELLGCGTFTTERAAFDELLAPQQAKPIQEAALQTLGRFSDDGVAELLLEKWLVLTPSLRSSAAELLFTRAAWTEGLLTAMEKQAVATSDIDSARVALLQSHPAESIRKRAASVFTAEGLGKRADVVAKYQQSLKMKGDADRGRDMFRKACSACHKLENVGTSLGADLNGIGARGLDAVLLNILDPNREIKSEFLSYVVVTTDGRVITGMISEETPNNLTIRQADGAAVAISRVDIEEMKSTGVSYMPEGLEKEIDTQSMADLLAYISSF